MPIEISNQVRIQQYEDSLTLMLGVRDALSLIGSKMKLMKNEIVIFV